MTTPTPTDGPPPASSHRGEALRTRARSLVAAVRRRFEGSWLQELLSLLKRLDFGNPVVLFGAALLLTVLPMMYGVIGVVFTLVTWFIAIGAVIVLGASCGAVWQARLGRPREPGPAEVRNP